jgi:hypothetical protein
MQAHDQSVKSETAQVQLANGTASLNNHARDFPPTNPIDHPLRNVSMTVDLNDDDFVVSSRTDDNRAGGSDVGTTVASWSHESPHSPPNTLAAYMAKHPELTVKQAMRKLYPKPNPVKRFAHRFQVKHSVIAGLTEKETKHWKSQGPELRRKAGWKLPGEEGPGAEVSELFWKMYLSLMPTIVRDPLAGMTTPDLLGSTTTMPLSIISLIPDIIKHFHDVIVRAQKEVFIATNYWQ